MFRIARSLPRFAPVATPSFFAANRRRIISLSASQMSSDNTKKGAGLEDVALKKLGVTDPKQVTEAQWKEVLPTDAWEVARDSGTEAPKSGAYDDFFKKGRYVCLCCGAELFNSDSKFWAGCGWPAFSKSVDNDMNITRIEDNSYGMKRVEVRCKPCNAHLGHVFDDGPKETGERYCINSVCMAFEPAEEAKQ